MTTEKKVAVGWDFAKMLIAAVLACAGFYAKLNADNAVRDERQGVMAKQLDGVCQKVFVDRTAEINKLSNSDALFWQKLDALEINNTAAHVALTKGQDEIKKLLQDHMAEKVSRSTGSATGTTN